MPESKDLLQVKQKPDTDVQYLIDSGILPQEIQNVREIVNDFDGSQLDEFNDGIIYRAYHAALHCRTQTLGTIAKALGISRKLLEYYLKQYPKLGLAIQVGYMDSIDYLKEDLVNALTQVALGTSVQEVSVTNKQVLNKFGEVHDLTDTKTTTRQIAPDTTAILELMKRIDPAWVPKVAVDVQQNINHTFNVKEDINVAVDYRKLSPSALRELIDSAKDMGSNVGDVLHTEDDGTTRKHTNIIRDALKDPNHPKRPSRGGAHAKKLKEHTDSILKGKTTSKKSVKTDVNKGVKNNEQQKETRKRGRPRKS